MAKIINKNLYLLYMNNEVKKVFTRKPMISFRSARKESYMVRAKLYPEERTKGSFKCGSKRCEVCLNVNETSTFDRQLQVKLISLTTNFIVMINAWFIF